jgi:hypothetical protein
MLSISVTITGRSICSVSSYCDNNGGGLYVVLTIIVTTMTITWRSIGMVNSYCDNNSEV